MANPWQIEEAQPYRPGSLTAAALASPLYCAMKRMFTRPGQPCGLDDSYELASVFAGTLLSDGHMKLAGNRFYFVLMVTCRGYLEQIKTIPWFAACQIREIREYLKPDGILQTGMLEISSGFPRAQAADLYALFYVDGVKRIPAELLNLGSAGSRISRSTPDFLGAVMCGDGSCGDCAIVIALNEQCRGKLVADGRRFLRYLAAPMLNHVGNTAVDINDLAGFKHFVLNEDGDMNSCGTIEMRKTVTTWGEDALTLPTAPGSSSPLRTEANRFKMVVVLPTICSIAYPHKGILILDDDKLAAHGANQHNKNYVTSKREEIKDHLLHHRADPNDPDSGGATQESLLLYCGPGAGNLGLSVVAVNGFLRHLVVMESCLCSRSQPTRGMGLYTPNHFSPVSGNEAAFRKRHVARVLDMCLNVQDVFQRTPLLFAAHVAEWRRFWDENGLVYLPPGTRRNGNPRSEQRRGMEELKKRWLVFSQAEHVVDELRSLLPDGKKKRFRMRMQLDAPWLIAKQTQRRVAVGVGA